MNVLLIVVVSKLISAIVLICCSPFLSIYLSIFEKTYEGLGDYNL
jgi:hypothetical protein